MSLFTDCYLNSFPKLKGPFLFLAPHEVLQLLPREEPASFIAILPMLSLCIRHGMFVEMTKLFHRLTIQSHSWLMCVWVLVEGKEMALSRHWQIIQ